MAKYAEADWREYEEAKRHLPSGVSLVEAAIFYANSNLDPQRPGSLEKAVEAYLKLKEKSVDSSTYAGYRTALNDLKARHAIKPLEAIKASDLLEILDGLSESGATPVTIRNRYNCWRVFFKWIHRKRYVKSNALLEIDFKTELPALEESEKHPLRVDQVQAIMQLLECGCPDRRGRTADVSRFLLWAALQFFLGARTSEADRFRYEWIQKDLGRIYIPRWSTNRATGEKKKGAKTKDPWAIVNIERNFWTWFERQPDKKPEGLIPVPTRATWEKDIQPAILAACGLATWPSNAKRDSFATYHISLYKNPGATALVLKHKNPVMLYKSYLGKIVRPEIARTYFSIVPRRDRESFVFRPPDSAPLPQG